MSLPVCSLSIWTRPKVRVCKGIGKGIQLGIPTGFPDYKLFDDKVWCFAALHMLHDWAQMDRHIYIYNVDGCYQTYYFPATCTSNQIVPPKYQKKCITIFFWPLLLLYAKAVCWGKEGHLEQKRSKEDSDALFLILWSNNVVASAGL